VSAARVFRLNAAQSTRRGAHLTLTFRATSAAEAAGGQRLGAPVGRADTDHGGKGDYICIEYSDSLVGVVLSERFAAWQEPGGDNRLLEGRREAEANAPGKRPPTRWLRVAATHGGADGWRQLIERVASTPSRVDAAGRPLRD
jgi:hypothetical protein